MTARRRIGLCHVPLPRAWPEHAKSALLTAVALARLSILHVRGWAADSPLQRARLSGDKDAFRSEAALLRREMEIKDRRWSRLAPDRRPHYLPEDRFGILAVRAARGWTGAETARRFMVDEGTIRLWTRRCDEQGADALVRTPTPVNRYDDCITALVQQLASTLPTMGTRRISDLLARAALHLAPTTVGRMRRRPLGKPPAPSPVDGAQQSAASGDAAAGATETPAAQTETGGTDDTTTESSAESPGADSKPEARTVIARYVGHVWSADLTVMPIAAGLALPWSPWSLPQRWPFAWWLLLVVDHFSRAIVHVAVFRSQPSANEVCAALDEAVVIARGPPKYMVTDQGEQFGAGYRDWCDSHAVRPRFGAIGKTGSIAVTERLIRTVKSEGLRRFLLPFRDDEMLAELALVARWYNEHRPHRRFHGATPDEIRSGRTPATELPRFEPRAGYPVADELRAERGVRLELQIDYLEGRKHLPIVSLRPAA